MTIFSRLAGPGRLVSRKVITASQVYKILAVQLRSSSDRPFIIREGVLKHRRVRDHLFFYMVQLPVIFFLLPFVAWAIYAGEPELHDEPTDRVPRHYEYENTTYRRAFAYFAPINTQGLVESKTGYWYKHMLQMRIRNIRQRILHLQHERVDYKGFAYVPMKDRWVHEAKVDQERQRVSHTLRWVQHTKP